QGLPPHSSQTHLLISFQSLAQRNEKKNNIPSPLVSTIKPLKRCLVQFFESFNPETIFLIGSCLQVPDPLFCHQFERIVGPFTHLSDCTQIDETLGFCVLLSFEIVQSSPLLGGGLVERPN